MAITLSAGDNGLDVCYELKFDDFASAVGGGAGLAPLVRYGPCRL
jgi:hypothetical protein